MVVGAEAEAEVEVAPKENVDLPAVDEPDKLDELELEAPEIPKEKEGLLADVARDEVDDAPELLLLESVLESLVVSSNGRVKGWVNFFTPTPELAAAAAPEALSPKSREDVLYSKAGSTAV